MTALRHPIVTVASSLFLAIAIGVLTFQRAATGLVAHVLELRARAAAAVPKKEKGWDFWTIEIENLSNELKEEKARLQKQADGIEQREMRLAAERKELEAMRAEIEALRKEIADQVITIREDEAKNLRALSQTYTNLTPRAAVAIFREMDDQTAVKILFLMKPDVVGPIFEEMSKGVGADGSPLSRRAAILSEKLRLLKAKQAAAKQS